MIEIHGIENLHDAFAQIGTIEWHPVARPSRDSAGNKTFTGVVVGGALNGNTLTAAWPSLDFVVPRREEPVFYGVPSVLNYRPIFEPERYIYQRCVFSDVNAIIGYWECGGSQPTVPPLPSGNRFVIEYGDLELGCGYSMQRNEQGWVVTVNNAHVRPEMRCHLDESLENPSEGTQRRMYSFFDDLHEMRAIRRRLTSDEESTLNDFRREILMRSVNNNHDATYYDEQPNPHRTSIDSSTTKFDLEPTEECWKNIGGGLTCGEPPDPGSETGMCKTHKAEVRAKYKR